MASRILSRLLPAVRAVQRITAVRPALSPLQPLLVSTALRLPSRRFFSERNKAASEASTAAATEVQGLTNDDADVIAVIQDLLDNRIRPSVQMDGGDIQFKSFKDGVVKLEFHGACVGCPSSSVTLKMFAANMIKHYCPEVKEVEQWVGDEVAEKESREQLKRLEEEIEKKKKADEK